MILLVVPNAKKENYTITLDEFSAIQPNIYMALLLASLKGKGIDADMIDAEVENISMRELTDLVDTINPDLLGVICMGSNPSSSTMSMIGAEKFLQELNQRSLKTKTFLWGGHPTALPGRSLLETGADYVIMGEGYSSIPKLHTIVMANGYHSRVVPPDPLVDLDTLPMIDWGELNPSKYRAHNWHCFGELDKRSPYGVIWTSFGCPHQCDFCCINNLFGKRTYRTRSMTRVVEEIGVLVEKYGVRQIKIVDELFVTKHPRIDEFCELLEKKRYDLNMWCFARTDSVDERILKRLKGVGMNWISYGFENLNQGSLAHKNNKISHYDDVVKMTRNAGMNICADFIVGLPEDNHESLEETYKFWLKHNFEFINLYPAFAFPGTPLFDTAIREGYMEYPKTWEGYSLFGRTCKPLGTKFLTPAQVLEYRDKAYIHYSTNPIYLSMIEKKFGVETKEHILKMLEKPLRRDIYD